MYSNRCLSLSDSLAAGESTSNLSHPDTLCSRTTTLRRESTKKQRIMLEVAFSLNSTSMQGDILTDYSTCMVNVLSRIAVFMLRMKKAKKCTHTFLAGSGLVDLVHSVPNCHAGEDVTNAGMRCRMR